MAATIEVKYFNTFWLKKVVWKDGVDPTGAALDAPSYGSAWPGLPWDPYNDGTPESIKLDYSMGANTIPVDDEKLQLRNRRI